MPKPPLIFWQPFGGASGGEQRRGAEPGGRGVPRGAGGDAAGSGPGPAASPAALNLAASAEGLREYRLPPHNSSGKQMKCLKGYCEYRLKYDPLASANFSDKILQGLLFLSK